MSTARGRAEAALVAVAILWGGTFAATKSLGEVVAPMHLVALRFSLAFAALIPLLGRALSRVGRREVVTGIAAGLVLWGAFYTQTAGVMRTTATKGAFISSMSVVLVPLLAILILRRLPELSALLGAAVAALGLSVIALGNLSSLLRLNFFRAWSPGDLLVLGSAALFALQIVLVDRFARQSEARLFAWVQIGTVAAAAWLAAGFVEPAPDRLGWSQWLQLAYLGVLATAVALVVQAAAQQSTSPTRVGVIFALEPVSGAAIAALLLQEPLRMRDVLGGALILAGLLLSETDPFQALLRALRRQGGESGPTGDPGPDPSRR